MRILIIWYNTELQKKMPMILQYQKFWFHRHAKDQSAILPWPADTPRQSTVEILASFSSPLTLHIITVNTENLNSDLQSMLELSTVPSLTVNISIAVGKYWSQFIRLHNPEERYPVWIHFSLKFLGTTVDAMSKGQAQPDADIERWVYANLVLFRNKTKQNENTALRRPQSKSPRRKQ
jgi:hypothetical protein